MILVFGKNGLLGAEIVSLLEAHEVPFLSPERAVLDLLDHEKVLSFIKRQAPSKIILCAAYANVEKAEHKEQVLCRKMNVEVVKNLLKTEIPLIHFSTDYVFGHYEAGVEIEEDFKREPLNYYGQTKYEAEKLLEVAKVPFWNLRTSWLYGAHGKHFVSTLLKASQEKKVLSVIDDQVGRPTYAQDLALFVLEHFIKKETPSGHYHLQNSGPPVSWAGFAECFLNHVNWGGRIKKISSSDWGGDVERPKNSFLKNTKLKNNLPDWRDSVEAFLRTEKDSIYF